MVNVKSVIFFGKSEKNIWVLDFFNYNHKYETVKQIKQIYSWNSITAKTVITVWNGIIVITVIAVITVITVITAITCNSRADTTAKHLEQIQREAVSQIKQSNS